MKQFFLVWIVLRCFVLWDRFAGCRFRLLKSGPSFAQDLCILKIEKVEAVSEVDDGSDHRGIFSVLACPVISSFGAMFPKVDALA